MSTRVVVIGGGLAGMVTAAALRGRFDEIVVLERDKLPGGAEARKGVPQAVHAHLMLSGGARVIESLVPGFLDRMYAEGAHDANAPGDLVTMMTVGWMPRRRGSQFFVGASRVLLDWVVRDLVARDQRVRIHTESPVTELIGDARRVRGVRGPDGVLEADLVVDAAGRGTRAPKWLGELGVDEARTEVIDSGLAYSTRIFQAPEAARTRFPVINVQPDSRVPLPGRGGGLQPIEGGRWIVTVSGTRGGEPPTTVDGYTDFVNNQLRHPILGELIARAEPLTEVHASRSTANRRYRYDEVELPEGFVALGDSVAAFNPVYGHGMSIAAHGAFVLRAILAGGGSTREAQRAICKVGVGAWQMATGQDVHFPDVRGTRPGRLDLARRAYVDRMSLTAVSRPRVYDAMVGAFTLARPMSSLMAPGVLLDVLRGPIDPPLAGPPLSTDERRRAGL
ncbi:FAD-dependent oxidoreductase [Allokutzneria sp. A3M-2-11 16]|uniref:NAD(P)/FAD-dependent oxidoreductase n=1 Tax=Allokutzneria sp. A3M-2-11 16 TaxID=2962043 RepID=UPI0020B8B72A|nr:FAD-dependent oxidoreductase [Allokutzneria sp. A3M-2-11 16]MCP3804890.1 FAD-dependent oxidoreductase [Allokutzneria sp. A3M-2-11 16]